jgi:hypothetical protein
MEDSCHSPMGDCAIRCPVNGDDIICLSALGAVAQFRLGPEAAQV